MEEIIQIDADFINDNTSFKELILAISEAFASGNTIAPLRHHHDFPNPKIGEDSTLLLMPAWNPSESAGVKIVTVSPENGQFDLPSINGAYIYMDATRGTIKAILEAKSLTAKRTAAASGLASSFLSRKDASSLLMIGTGTLSINLIKAHKSVRPITAVYVWGRNFKKALAVCDALGDEKIEAIPIQSIEEKISEVDIISCATLSKVPLVFGKNLRSGQHVDLVGAYKKDMRESDDLAIQKSQVYLDTFQGGLKESGDIVQPLEAGILQKEDVQADLFQLCSKINSGRKSNTDITLFKSVGHALEDLAAAKHYFEKYNDSLD